MLATANAGKNREGFWKNAGEWTVRVEINEEEQLKITRINKKTKKYEHAGEKRRQYSHTQQYVAAITQTMIQKITLEAEKALINT